MTYPVGERLANPETYPVAFAHEGEVFWRGHDSYFRWWRLDMAENLLAGWAPWGWPDLVEPLRAAIAEAKAYYHETQGDA